MFVSIFGRKIKTSSPWVLCGIMLLALLGMIASFSAVVYAFAYASTVLLGSSTLGIILGWTYVCCSIQINDKSIIPTNKFTSVVFLVFSIIGSSLFFFV